MKRIFLTRIPRCETHGQHGYYVGVFDRIFMGQTEIVLPFASSNEHLARGPTTRREGMNQAKQSATAGAKCQR